MIKLIFIKNNLIFFICVKYYFNALYFYCNLYKVHNGLIYRVYYLKLKQTYI